MDKTGAAKKQRRKSSRMSMHGGDGLGGGGHASDHAHHHHAHGHGHAHLHHMHSAHSGLGSGVGDPDGGLDSQDEAGGGLGGGTSTRRSSSTDHHPRRDDLIDPYWVEDKILSRGEVDYLSGPEVQFWTDLIEKYLHPLDADQTKQARITAGLKELRNKSVFFFSVFNALFVLIIFMLTLHKDTLYINWPLGVRENITYTEDDQILVTKEYLHLEPIGIVLVFFFSLIIIIQVSGQRVFF